jgi:hypothetical protein
LVFVKLTAETIFDLFKKQRNIWFKICQQG